MPEPARNFPRAVQSFRGEEPLLIGAIGPPGGGKTVSMLRLAEGMRRIRGGPVVLIDTEGGRSKKYSPKKGDKPDPAALKFDFMRVDFAPPFRSHDFLALIKEQLPLNPSAIIVDTQSDEHEGEGGYLEWHQEIVDKRKGEPDYVGGNEWAAWAKPKAARKRLISGLLQIKVPLLFTFRAREKTAQTKEEGNGKAKIINIGWMPVAPLEIVHCLDLTCILPPRADGVPIWTSEKIGEDFIVKLPYFLQPLIGDGQLSEETGEALARWAMGLDAADQGDRDRLLAELQAAITARSPGDMKDAKLGRAKVMREALGAKDWAAVKGLPLDKLEAGLARLQGAKVATSPGPRPLGPDRAQALQERAMEAEMAPSAFDALVRRVGEPFGGGLLADLPETVEAEILREMETSRSAGN